jgi:hypothetical protein
VPSWLWIQEVVFPLIGFAMGGFVLYGVYRTINRVLERRHELRLGEAGSVTEAVRRLEDRVAMLEEHGGRIQELEERVDFTERMLAKHGERPLLGDH